ncbi:hypothetical protein PTTW11_03160 [Pyrenophora teres f. teres]|uniref:Uncharacterized protein n=1 Tax=Pyrenophora teres f. teres TaxID=97479 RepID=A0A6S6VG87_9PLEO|nr:hypothetical protein PTTW11_03160 [Pyrenophora teres f. teres]
MNILSLLIKNIYTLVAWVRLRNLSGLHTEQEAQSDAHPELLHPQPRLKYDPSKSPLFSDLRQQLPEPDKQAHRGFLESQLHNVLAELDKTPSTTLSLRQRLESQAHDTLRLLNGLPPEPCTCPQHPDTAKDLGEARADNSKDMHLVLEPSSSS